MRASLCLLKAWEGRGLAQANSSMDQQYYPQAHCASVQNAHNVNNPEFLRTSPHFTPPKGTKTTAATKKMKAGTAYLLSHPTAVRSFSLALSCARSLFLPLIVRMDRTCVLRMCVRFTHSAFFTHPLYRLCCSATVRFKPCSVVIMLSVPGRLCMA